MAARLVDVCEAVKDFLNAESFSQSFTATRKNRWAWKVEDAANLQVTVLPNDVETTELDRSRAERKFNLIVVIAKKVATQEQEDELLLLAEELEDALYAQPMASYAFESFSATTGSRVAMESDPALNTGLFRTVLELTYRGL